MWLMTTPRDFQFESAYRGEVEELGVGALGLDLGSGRC